MQNLLTTAPKHRFAAKVDELDQTQEDLNALKSRSTVFENSVQDKIQKIQARLVEAGKIPANIAAVQDDLQFQLKNLAGAHETLKNGSNQYCTTKKVRYERVTLKPLNPGQLSTALSKKIHYEIIFFHSNQY